MRYETTGLYSETLIRSVTRQFLMRFLGLDFFAVIAILALICVSRLVGGDRGWLVGASGAVAAIGASVMAAVWITYHRRGLAVFRRMKDPQVHFVFDDDGIAFASDLGEGRLKWNALREIWCLKDAWLIFVDRGVYSTLPGDCLTAEIRQFVRAKAKENGVKIRGRDDSKPV